MYKSPNRMKYDFDYQNIGILNIPGTPGTPKSIKAPRVVENDVR